MGQRKLVLRQRTKLSQRLKYGVGFGGFYVAAFILLSTFQIGSGTDLHLIPACPDDCSVYTLSWGKEPGMHTWEMGELSHTYYDVNHSGTNWTFTYSGATANLGALGEGMTPNVQTILSGGKEYALTHYASNGLNREEPLSLEILIDPPIAAQIGFDLYHINGSWYGGDAISIYAETEQGDNFIYPEFVDNGSPSWEVKGAGVLEAMNNSTEENDAFVGVNFDSPEKIRRLMIHWKSCLTCGEGAHEMAIGALSFCHQAPDFKVEWGEASARWRGGQAVLFWESKLEFNTDHFVISRGEENKHFVEVGRVPAAGNHSGISKYVFTDIMASSVRRQSILYEVHLVGRDGAMSKAIEIKLPPPEIQWAD